MKWNTEDFGKLWHFLKKPLTHKELAQNWKTSVTGKTSEEVFWGSEKILGFATRKVPKTKREQSPTHGLTLEKFRRQKER
jgi:hypothetical protein